MQSVFNQYQTTQCRNASKNRAQDFGKRKAYLRHLPLFKQLGSAQAKLQFDIPETATRPKEKPFWLHSPPQVEYLFVENKSGITPTEVLARFNEFKSQNADKLFIYTDGSKQGDKVGYAMATARFQHSRRLPDKLSIFTAEAVALYTAVLYCVKKKQSNVVICSDSKSALQALKNVHTQTHPIISQIQSTIPGNQNITFLWIPGHANIPGNETADKLAKQALDIADPLVIKYPVDDCKSILQQHMKQLQQRTWDNASTDDTGQEHHSHIVKPLLGPWASAKQNTRQKEVMLTRLRTGRTRLNVPWAESQQCTFCNTGTAATVKHILLECSHFDLHRRHIIAYCRQENVSLTLAKLLGDSCPELLRLLFRYLQDTDLFKAL